MNSMINHYKYVFEHLPTPIWIKSINNDLLYINQSFADFFHLTPDKVIGYSLETLIASTTNSSLIQLYKSIQINNNTTRTTIKTDLGLFKHLIFVYPDKMTHQDIVLGLLLMSSDVSGPSKQNLLETIMDNVPEMIFYKNQEGCYKGANKPCRDFYSAQGVDDLLGKTDLELPLDRNFIETCIKHDQIVIKSQKPLVFEEDFITPDGHKEVLETIKTPVFDEEGKLWGIVGVVRDITTKKSYEDKLRYLSYTDTLSGLYNRAYFNESITEMIEKNVFPIGFILGDVNGLKIVNDTLGHLAGDKLIQATARQLTMVCPEKSLIFRWGGDEFIILLPHSSKEECEGLMTEISKACDESKWHTPNTDENLKLSISLGYSLFKDKSDNIDEVLQDAEDKLYRQKILSEKSVRSSILLSLQNSLKARDPETQAHTQRIVESCLAIGKALNLDSDLLDELALVAKLHDIGKIGIPESIHLKSTKLTPEEVEIIKTHSEKGYRLTNLFPELSHISRAILTHHEKWDGSGYPLGLKGEEIPLIARIVSVVDAYDAMTSNRTYNHIKSKEEALQELKRCANTHFDPHIVEVFCKLVE